MKKIYYIFIILITFTIISCNDSSSNDLPDEYIDPFSNAPAAPSLAKGYTITTTPAFSPPPSCGGDTCKAIIYQGQSQSGIAVAGSNFDLKIYWNGIIATTISQYTIKINYNNNVYTTDVISPSLAITDSGSGMFNIVLAAGSINIPISGAGSPLSITINSMNINAFKY